MQATEHYLQNFQSSLVSALYCQRISSYQMPRQIIVNR